MYKFTDKSFELRNVDINMRFQSELLTDEFGIDVLFIHNCKFVRCRCFDDLHKTGDPNCQICHGTGYFASIQKIKAIESSNSAYSDTSSILQTALGVTDQKNEIYYIRQQYNPKERDMILKVTWDKKGNPIDILKVLEITNVWEMRGDSGRIELNGCVINDRTDLMTSYSQTLRKLSNKGLAELLKGGKYIWPAQLLTR